MPRAAIDGNIINKPPSPQWANNMAPASPRQLLNTSWTLHRLSPLHHRKEFQTLLGNPVALKTYASRLRDQLTGDVLIGLQPTGDDDGLSKTGALRDCTWETMEPWSQLSDGEDMDLDMGVSDNAAGILIALEYENVVYKAALLTGPGSEGHTPQESSTSLPVLLTRFPNALRQTLVSFLSANFDTYCSVLRLPQNFMCSALEVYFNTFLSSDRPNAEEIFTLEDVLKDMQLTLSFSGSVAPELRSLNVNIPRASLSSFLTARPPAGGSLASKLSNPFLSALSGYLDEHLALKLDLSDSTTPSVARRHVRLGRIACGSFVLGSEGRLKLVFPERAGNGSSSGGDDGVPNEKERLTLQASRALLQAIIRRATIGEKRGT